MWLGIVRNSKRNPLNVSWTESVNVLGIVFSYNEKLANDRNFEDKITSLKQTLALWKNLQECYQKWMKFDDMGTKNLSRICILNHSENE